MATYNVTIETTSNPAILKFEANQFLTQATSYEFKNIDEAKDSPLAQQLFYLPFVKTVFISQNFIAVERFDIVNWKDVQEEVRQAIETYLNEGKPLFNNTNKTPNPISFYVESTPNPEVYKFVANKALTPGLFEFKQDSNLIEAPLAAALFNFPFVKEVFCNENYIAITKTPQVSWEAVATELRNFLTNYIEEGNPILTDAILNAEKDQQNPTNRRKHAEAQTDIDSQIINILDEYITPAVAGDGGHIAFQSFDAETKTVRVLLQGACSGCPSSTLTLKNGIENLLKELLTDKVAHVEALNG